VPVVIGKTSQSAIVELQQAATNPFREGCAGQSGVVDGPGCSLQDFLARMINPLVGLGIVAVSKYLGVEPGLHPHLGLLAFTLRRIACKTLTEFFILVLDVLADQPKQLAFGQLGRIHCGLGLGRLALRRGILQGVEAGVPLEVSERPEFLRLCQTGRVQRILNELLANFFDEVLRHLAAVVIDAIAAKQMLIARHLFHPRLCITNVRHRGMLRR
jgi:hypothetical protein